MPRIETALTLARSGDHRAALAAAKAACQEAGETASLLTLMGELHVQLGEPAAAVAHFLRATRLTPRDAGSFRRLAAAQFAAQAFGAAAASYRRALEIEPDDARAWNNLGQVHERLEERAAALDCYRRALAVDPAHAIAHGNLAHLLAQSGNLGAALESYQQAVALRPEFVEAWVGRARTLEALERSSEALGSCDQALALRPHQPRVLFARANLLRGMGDAAAAVAGFQRALDLDPGFDAARIAAAIAHIPALGRNDAELAQSRIAFAAALADVARQFQDRRDIDAPGCVGAVQPFHLAYQEENHRTLLGAHGALCADLMARWQQREAPVSVARRRASRLPRIAIVSAHIGDHSVYNAITRGWVMRLDRSRFTVDVFHIGVAHDALTDEAQGAAEHFVSGLETIRDWMEAIAEHAPDVVLYPELGINQTALQLAALRLAPVQAVAWGHPITSGLPTLDYYLSAQAFEPADGADHYTEKLVRLPNLGAYVQPAVVQSSLGAAHGNAAAGADAGSRRETDGPVFVCAGTPFKYAPQYDAVLVDIARRLGACQFHFFAYRDGSLSRRLMERLHQAFSAAGLDASRHLVLRPWAAAADFHAFLQRADLYLDTLGFSGFNTVLQALECGLPVVSYRGRFMRGRLGAGLLERLGLEGLVAGTPREYADIVVALMSDADAVGRVRQQLRMPRQAVHRDDAVIGALENFLAAVAP